MSIVYKYKKAYKKYKEQDKSLFGAIFFSPIYLYFFISQRIFPERLFIKLNFKKIYGFFPDLENPKTLNEKLQWKKLYDKNPIYTLCSDKYKVRDYIKKKIGKKYLIPLLYHTTNPKNINFSKIPEPFIVKANHGSGMNIPVKDKSKVDFELIRKNCKGWLKKNFYYLLREWQYKNIKPRILIEKLLLNKDGNIPPDYKFHCFHGKVKFIQVDTNRFTNHQRTMYDRDWNLTYFNWCEKKEFGNDPANDINKDIKKPKKYEEMIRLSEKLSKDFDYVRVDLYDVDGEIYFGELTFGHGGGYLSFFPKKYDKIYGDMLNLNKNEKK